MDEKKEGYQESGTCFDSMDFSELRKLMEMHGFGSLCKEMMSKVLHTGEGESVCARFIEQMKTEQGKTGEKAEKNGEHKTAL